MIFKNSVKKALFAVLLPASAIFLPCQALASQEKALLLNYEAIPLSTTDIPFSEASDSDLSGCETTDFPDPTGEGIRKKTYKESMKRLKLLSLSGQAVYAVGCWCPVLIAAHYNEKIRKSMLIEPFKKAVNAKRMYNLVRSVYRSMKGKDKDKTPYYKKSFRGRGGKKRPSLLDRALSLPSETPEAKEARFLEFTDELIISGRIFTQPENLPVSTDEFIYLINNQVTEPRHLVFETFELPAGNGL